MAQKKKLLVLAGAGASLEFGMPSTDSIDKFLSCAAGQNFCLSEDPSANLYTYIKTVLSIYWADNRTKILGAPPTFEDVLLAIAAIESMFPVGAFTGPLGAFAQVNELPDIVQFGRRTKVDDFCLSELSVFIVDTILEDIRERCIKSVSNVQKLHEFIEALSNNFDVSFVTTNYDNLLDRCAPNNTNGFEENGRFDAGLLFNRRSWPCTLHLHGSVHFSMDINHEQGDLHSIYWQDDLAARFPQNASGRSSLRSSYGSSIPTSVIIAGGSKSEQLFRQPFRSYYSELDRLIQTSDALLICGFSFIDEHITQAFSGYWNSRDRPTVLIDYAADNEMLAGSGFGGAPDSAAERLVRMARVRPDQLTARGFAIPDEAKDLKDEKDFQRCNVPGRKLSLWYNGMLEACHSIDKVIRELV